MARREVGVRCRVDITEVDVVKEEVHLQCTVALHCANKDYVRDPAVVGKFKPCPEEMASGHRPVRLRFLNTTEAEEVDSSLLYSVENGTIFHTRIYRVTVRETMELERFPYDRQLIKLQIQCFGADLKEWWVPMEDTPFRIRNCKSWSQSLCIAQYASSEWDLDMADYHFEKENAETLFCVRCGLTRRPQYYLWNFVLMLFIIVEMASFTLAIDVRDFSARASLTYTLLLTIVAFKLVASTFTPRISYLTFLDKYATFGTVMLGIVILVQFVIAQLVPAEDDLAFQLDIAFTVLFNVIWVGVHVIIVVGTRAGWFYENWPHVIANDTKAEFLHAKPRVIAATSDQKRPAASGAPSPTGEAAPLLSS